MSNSSTIIHKRGIRIILILFVTVLLFAGSMNVVEHFFRDDAPIFPLTVTTRNKKIDSMKANISMEEQTSYTYDDINNCISIIKDEFKSKDKLICLTEINFDEEECNYLRDISSYVEKYGKENLLVIECNFYVYHSFESYDRGLYDGWQMIFAKENETSQWQLIDCGYA